MSRDLDFWQSLRSPNDLFAAAGVEPPSPAVECIHDAIHAAPPTKVQRRLWAGLSPQPWPSRRMRRAAVAVGRRGLKTSGILARDVCFESLNPEHDAYALSGSRVFCVVVAPRLPQSREAVRAIRQALDLLSPLGVSYEARDAAGSPEIVVRAPHLATERVVTVFASDAVAVRGRAVCYAAVDEASFLGSDEWLAQTDRDLIVALEAGTVQFPAARLLLVSSQGAPQGVFHKLVTKPPADTLTVQAATWLTNPRVSREDCLRIAGGDLDAFAQEFESSRWGYSGESYIDAAAVRACFDEKLGGAKPRPGGRYCIALDVGQVNDATALIVCSSYLVETRPGEGVRHVVVNELEIIASSKKAPTSLEAIADRVLALSRTFNGAPVVFDPFAGPTMRELLEARGFRDAVDADHFGPRRFLQVSMAPQHQTPRWKLVRDLVIGRRLHLHPMHEPLARQLAQLRATQMSSGALKVEGKKDDAADALALCAEQAVALPPTGSPEGDVTFRADGFGWSHSQGVVPRNARWVRVLPNGREVRADMPEHAPGFQEHAITLAKQGTYTPTTLRFFDRNPQLDPNRFIR